MNFTTFGNFEHCLRTVGSAGSSIKYFSKKIFRERNQILGQISRRELYSDIFDSSLKALPIAFNNILLLRGIGFDRVSWQHICIKVTIIHHKD